jgi:hypothetical protein
MARHNYEWATRLGAYRITGRVKPKYSHSALEGTRLRRIGPPRCPRAWPGAAVPEWDRVAWQRQLGRCTNARRASRRIVVEDADKAGQFVGAVSQGVEPSLRRV